jgi:hypothetical protein
MPLNELDYVLSMAEASIRRVPDVLEVTVHTRRRRKISEKEIRRLKAKAMLKLGARAHLTH